LNRIIYYNEKLFLHEYSAGAPSQESGPRLIAFYLPQYHPVPENDAWWGKGFTEWTNVVKARPRFRGHYQPHLPADLGFYDLRLPEARAAQAELARAYGIHGFCYYHYWFNGRRLLKRPFAEVLASGEPDFPFCLCWANESWSRRWLGEEQAVLIAQEYAPGDDRRHAEWLVQAFEDPRYLRVAGRPVFLIYRPDHLPNPRATAEVLRDVVTRAGLSSPWLVGVDAHRPGSDYRDLGFDATLVFEPQLGVFGPECFNDRRSLAKLRGNLNLGVFSAQLKLYDDGEARRRMAALTRPPLVHPCCYVSWDNSPRRGAQGIIIINSSPARFERALKAAVLRAESLPPEARLVFVNAWNEWAEGNHLEPDREHGRAYLDAVRRVVSGINGLKEPSHDLAG
jgi:hypothetical protein